MSSSTGVSQVVEPLALPDKGCDEGEGTRVEIDAVDDDGGRGDEGC